jgi:hypothetical protein
MGGSFVYIRNQKEPDWTAFDAVDCSPESFAFRYLYLPTCSVSLSAFHIAEREIEMFSVSVII